MIVELFNGDLVDVPHDQLEAYFNEPQLLDTINNEAQTVELLKSPNGKRNQVKIIEVGVTTIIECSELSNAEKVFDGYNVKN